MDSIKPKVSYLHGMMDGLSIDENSKEGKVLKEIVKVLGDIADKLDEIESNQDNLEMYIDTLDDDLQDVEEDFYGFEEADEFNGEDEFVEHQCQQCGETIYIDKSIIENDEHIKCPNCNFDMLGEGNDERVND
ncbi:MAG: hypothetical protein Q8930_00675 [Bacillota bacterium]|nr:hypothetical protein [Bacillota bacterium]